MKSIQKYSLRIFLTLMFVTAGLFLFMIWRGGPDEFDVISKLTFTSFVIGLANFLIWLVTMIFDIRDRIEKR